MKSSGIVDTSDESQIMNKDPLFHQRFLAFIFLYIRVCKKNLETITQHESFGLLYNTCRRFAESVFLSTTVTLATRTFPLEPPQGQTALALAKLQHHPLHRRHCPL